MSTISQAYINRPGKSEPVVPKVGNVTAVATGGTAVSAVLGPVVGGYIVNPANAAAQGLGSAENMYLDMVAAPGSTDAQAIGTTVLLVPGQDFYLPTLPDVVTVYVNAASNGHKFTCVVW